MKKSESWAYTKRAWSKARWVWMQPLGNSVMNRDPRHLSLRRGQLVFSGVQSDKQHGAWNDDKPHSNLQPCPSWRRLTSLWSQETCCVDRKQGFPRHTVLSKDIPITSLLAGLSDVALMVDTYVPAKGVSWWEETLLGLRSLLDTQCFFMLGETLCPNPQQWYKVLSTHRPCSVDGSIVQHSEKG